MSEFKGRHFRGDIVLWAVSAPRTASLTRGEEAAPKGSSGQVGGVEPGRQQRFDVAERPGVGQLGEHVAQVGVGLGSVRLCTLNERVQSGAGMCASHGIGREPAPASKAKRTDDVLDGVGVDAKP